MQEQPRQVRCSAKQIKTTKGMQIRGHFGDKRVINLEK